MARPAGAGHAAAVERIDRALASVRATRERLEQRIAASDARLTPEHAGAHGERLVLAVHEREHLARALSDLVAEERRLSLVREQLVQQAEALALRQEIALARHAAAEARHDAGDSLLDLASELATIEGELSAAARQAAFAEARASAIEELVARRTGFKWFEDPGSER